MAMKAKQMYFSEDLCDFLEKEFGEGRVSANVEKILWAYTNDSGAEKKIRWQELNKLLKHFNSDFQEGYELVRPEKEAPPTPPEEKEVAGL